MSLWQSAVAQWRSNRRLRLFTAVAIVALTANVAATLSESRASRVDAYRTDRALLARLEGAASDSAWEARAAEAETALASMEGAMVEVSSPGQAQAELQALLATAATTAGLADAAVRTEAASPVEGLPGVWEVSARLAASASGPSATALLRDLGNRPWLRVDRVEIRDGGPGQLQLIARSYFRDGGTGPTP
ncbi:MAG: hypothetical protein ACRC2H_05695 [Silanimonas sp.]